MNERNYARTEAEAELSAKLDNAMTLVIGNGTVSVWHDGRDYEPMDSGYRQRYGYAIAADHWEYVGNDVRSGCGAAVDVTAAAATLLSFLGACAESRYAMSRYPDWSGHREDSNASLFPNHVGEWAEANDDEISMAAIELEEEN